MLITRTILDSEIRKSVIEKWILLNKVSNIFNLEQKTEHAERDYNEKKCVEVNVLGLKMTYYTFYNIVTTDRIKRLIKKWGPKARKTIYNRACGLIISAIEGCIFDKDPIFVGEMQYGLERVMGEFFANFMEFGIKNFFGIVGSMGMNLRNESFLFKEEEIDGNEWIVMKSYKTPFLVKKDGIKGMNIPKLRSSFRVTESELKEKGGMGFEVKGMEDVLSFEDF